MKKNGYETTMEELLELESAGDYESASQKIDGMKKQAAADGYDLTSLEPEWGIACATLKMSEGNFEAALLLLEKSLAADNNNYEIYYMRGLCHEQSAAPEAAYYAYKMAMFLGRGSSDEELMRQQFEQLCGYAGACAYELGENCHRLILERLRLGEYEKTQEFLAEQLYDTNKTAAGIVLSEKNMLLFMMLEIALCERKKKSPYDTIAAYGCDPEKFNAVYRRVKLLVRRVWFGASVEEQRELNTVLEQHNRGNAVLISPDMLAVIIKYSIRQEYWSDAFARISAILQYRYPEVAAELQRYQTLIQGLAIQGEAKCMEPYQEGAEKKENLIVNRFDCAAMRLQEEDKRTDFAFLFCTNDALYEAECIRYLSRLTVPEGRTVKVVGIWNAKGMASGYNAAMHGVQADYKIYIHHDTFLVRRDFLLRLEQAFASNPRMGLLGIAGTKKLGPDGKWWKTDDPKLFRMNLYQDAILDILKSVTIEYTDPAEEVEALDGILLATREDLAWREDLFDGWHFYDISQCYEFRKHGWKVGVLNGGGVFMLHETTMKKDKDNLYDRYCSVFVNEYLRKGNNG